MKLVMSRRGRLLVVVVVAPAPRVRHMRSAPFSASSHIFLSLCP